MAELSQNPKPFARGAIDLIKTPWALIVALLVAVAAFDPGNWVAVVTFAAKALAHTGQYILFAVLLLSYLKATGAEVMVARAFEGRETRMILLAALFGGLAPFCSCEVIPFIAGLLALGAPLSAVMAFWLSSPLIDPPTLLITAGALGWPFAIGKARGRRCAGSVRRIRRAPADAARCLCPALARIQARRMLRLRTQTG